MNLINFIEINEKGEYSYSPKKEEKGVKTPYKKEKGVYSPLKKIKKGKGHNGQKRARMSFFEEF